MENKQQDDSTSRRQLLPPLYPAPRLANIGHASHHLLSSRPPFQFNPAATHFAAQLPSPYGSGSGATPGSSSFQMPPSPLSHVGASGHRAGSVGGSSALQAWHLYQSSLSGSGWKAAGSSHQRPPSPPSQAHASGGGADGLGLGGNSALLQSQGAFSGSSYFQMPPPSPLAMDPTSVRGVDGSSGGSTFVSSLDTASVMAPTRTQPLSSSSVGQESSNEYELPPLPPTLPPLQTMTVKLEDDVHAAPEHILPVDDEAPLPPCGPPPSETTTELEDLLGAAPQGISLVGNDNAVDVVGRQYMDLDSLNSSGDMGNNNTRVHGPKLAWSSLPIPADGRMNRQPLDWSFLVGRHPSSSTWMPRPNFSSNTNAMQAASQPLPFTINSQLPALAQLGTNNGSGSSSTWIQKQEPIFVESKPMLPPLPSPGQGWGGSSAGSSSRGRPKNKDDADPLVADFADGLFTQSEINTIMGEKTLAENVLSNPKSVRRIIRNRSNAQRGKQRKMAYVSDLESKAELLQQETKSLSERVQSMKSTADGLATEYNMMKLKLQGLEQQYNLMNDLNEALLAEVQRLTQLQQSQQSQGEA